LGVIINEGGDRTREEGKKGKSPIFIQGRGTENPQWKLRRPAGGKAWQEWGIKKDMGWWGTVQKYCTQEKKWKENTKGKAKGISNIILEVSLGPLGINYDKQDGKKNGDNYDRNVVKHGKKVLLK